VIAWEMRRVLSVLRPSRRAQPCQYEDVRREQDGRLADLSDASLAYVDLSHVLLSDADLSEAILVEADLSEAHLDGADLDDANLSGAKLSNAVGITNEGLGEGIAGWRYSVLVHSSLLFLWAGGRERGNARRPQLLRLSLRGQRSRAAHPRLRH
jgi:uncharacterized protein YjbI with pentapeptide repeats